jgi:hypothetical protein
MLKMPLPICYYFLMAIRMVSMFVISAWFGVFLQMLQIKLSCYSGLLNTDQHRGVKLSAKALA